jgi:hypothetical protein
MVGPSRGHQRTFEYGNAAGDETSQVVFERNQPERGDENVEILLDDAKSRRRWNVRNAAIQGTYVFSVGYV